MTSCGRLVDRPVLPGNLYLWLKLISPRYPHLVMEWWHHLFHLHKLFHQQRNERTLVNLTRRLFRREDRFKSLNGGQRSHDNQVFFGETNGSQQLPTSPTTLSRDQQRYRPYSSAEREGFGGGGTAIPNLRPIKATAQPAEMADAGIATISDVGRRNPDLCLCLFIFIAHFSRVLKWRSTPFDVPCGNILTPVTVSLCI